MIINVKVKCLYYYSVSKIKKAVNVCMPSNFQPCTSDWQEVSNPEAGMHSFSQLSNNKHSFFIIRQEGTRQEVLPLVSNLSLRLLDALTLRNYRQYNRVYFSYNCPPPDYTHHSRQTITYWLHGSSARNPTTSQNTSSDYWSLNPGLKQSLAAKTTSNKGN